MLFSMVGSLAIGESNRLTILSYDNSGEIKFDVDIEMEQGYWNTSSSRLWTKIRDLMHDELVEVYKDMRANGVTYEDIMHYMYDEQIARIPQSYFNQDYDIKYAPYADQYLGKAHGDGYQHMKRWLKKRFIFCDTLYDYAPSYNNDVLTIRANTLNEMNLTIETYTPLYQHVSFYNGNMEKIKITPGQPMTFKGFAQTETDQEVLIYGGSNIKKITGIQSMNPNSMLIGGATRLTELDISNCPILTIVNSNKANFSPHTYLNKLNMSNCPQLGGNLNVSNSPLLQEIKARNSAVTGLLLPTSLRNLKTLELPNTISSLALYDASSLDTLKFDEGVVMQSIELSNCAGITNTENFDLTKIPTVILDNSYNTEELYMSNTTNLTLKNMSSLKRVIFIPNSEYSAFDINNVINGANYKITTFNNPHMTDFITTAPHRDSYALEEYKEFIKGEVILKENFNANLTKFIDTLDFKPKSVEIKIDLSTCTVANENILSIGDSIENWEGIHCHFYYTKSSSQLLAYFNKSSLNSVDSTPETFTFNRFTLSSTILEIILNEEGLLINGVLQEGSRPISVYPSMSIGSQEGNVRSNATYLYIKAHKKEEWVNTMNITPNTAFTANTLDLADTQFQNVKFLCTTDIYNLKVPTTLKNFYCDSAMDIDTDVIKDASYEVIHEELIEPYTTNYEGEVLLNDETPNIIPSSANGSLIFNVYSNNTTQPTSISPYMWDLTGLKLNDFYTFGMNNNVKASDDSYVKLGDCTNLISVNGISSRPTYPNNIDYVYWDKGQASNKVVGMFILEPGVYNIYAYNNGTENRVQCNGSDSLTSGVATHFSNAGSVTFSKTQYVVINVPITTEYVRINDYVYYFDKIPYYENNKSGISMFTFTDNPLCVYQQGGIKLGEVKSITMPQRMPGYSVRLVNADITPNEYPTMLYPKWIDTMLPITGKLDYTAYNGTSLAWAYAYTTGDVTINPPSNISTSLDLSTCISLEETYVHQIINNLATVESATLTLGETYLAYLTEEEIEAAVNKGWTLE